MVRTFIIFHDCQHESYTPSPIMNYIISHITGAFVLTSPNWIIDHNTHHLTSGNKDNKYNYKFNELFDYTENQYISFKESDKILFTIFNNHYTFFSIVPTIYFGILHRFMYIIEKIKHKDKIQYSMSYIIFNHLLNNTVLFYFLYILYETQILIHYSISFYFAAFIGFFLFHNQHTFNTPYVVDNKEWTQKNSGLLGSSFIQVPWVLKYFTIGIEYHHIHHMNSKIPGYNLQKYHEEVVEKSNLFDTVVKLSLWDCYNNLKLRIYSEKSNIYIRLDELD